MKKLFYLISIISLLGSVTSCDKLNDANTSVDGFKTLKISATVLQDEMSKTFWRDSKVQWTAGDVITVLAQGTDPVMSTSVKSAAETSSFNVENWPKNVVPQYAVFNGPVTYSNTQFAPELDENGKITATLRSNQEIYHKGSFSKVANLSVGDLVEDNGVFKTTMKNVCGLIKFELENDARSVVIEDLDNNPLTGKVQFVMENGEPKVSEVVSGESTVTVVSKIDGSTDKLTAGVYFACVLPGTYTPKITVTPVEGEPFELTANSSIDIKRNEYMDFGKLKYVETRTITVDMTTSENPFVETLRTSQTAEYVEYTLVDGGYKFGFYNAYKSGTNIRLTGNTNLGYVKFPAIEGFKLTNMTLKSGASSDKYIRLWSENPLEDGAKELTGYTLKGTNKTTEEQSFDIKDPQVGVAYYISSVATNTQFSKLVLTYKNN